MKKYNYILLLSIIVLNVYNCFSDDGIGFLDPFKSNCKGFTFGISNHYLVGNDNEYYRLNFSIKYGPYYLGKGEIKKKYKISYKKVNPDSLKGSCTISQCESKEYTIDDLNDIDTNKIKIETNELNVIKGQIGENITKLDKQDNIKINYSTKNETCSIISILDTNKDKLSFHFGYSYYNFDKLNYEYLHLNKFNIGGMFVTATISSSCIKNILFYLFSPTLREYFNASIGITLNYPNFSSKVCNTINDKTNFKITAGSVYSPEIFFILSCSPDCIKGVSIYADYGYQKLKFTDVSYSTISSGDASYLESVKSLLPQKLDLSNQFVHLGISFTFSSTK
jgi:hypothetical protein